VNHTVMVAYAASGAGIFSGSLLLLDLGKTRGPWLALGSPLSETAGCRNKFDQWDVAQELATRAATPSAASG